MTVGALLVVIFRDVIGMKTLGTLMTILVSLAFRETELGWGIFLLSLIVGMGLLVRFYLNQLKLLLVPRLAFGDRPVGFSVRKGIFTRERGSLRDCVHEF